jgi:hypothetical protein
MFLRELLSQIINAEGSSFCVDDLMPQILNSVMALAKLATVNFVFHRYN